MRLFKKRPVAPEPVVPTTPFTYPSGVCVETESGRYYLKGNKKYRITSDQVFKSWSFPTVLKSSDQAISKYSKSLRPLGLRDGSVVRNIMNMELFIIADGKKCRIVSMDMFNVLGLQGKNIPYVSPEVIGMHPDGDDI